MNERTRTVERMHPFLERLADLWEEFPEQRFGQLLMNLSRYPENGLTSDGMFQDVWEWDVAEYEAAIRRFRMLYKLDLEESK